jgi:IS30 family transposase
LIAKEMRLFSPHPLCLLAIDEKLRTIVASKLILDWSPEQISKGLKVHYPNNESMRVSHETIYRSLFIQARGVLKKELVQHLRSRRLIRRSRHSRAAGQSRGQIVDAISISERPVEVEDRAVPVTGRATCSQAAKTVRSSAREFRFRCIISP